MTKEITHSQLKNILDVYFKSKMPLMVYGRFGIGKSYVIKEKAEELAKEQNKEFIEWNKITEEKKNEVFKNNENYFVFIDIRLSEYDSTDIKGLPIFQENNRAIEFKTPFWALLLEQEKSNGVLFFDEMNLATPLVLSSCYKIIYDRIINNSKINDDWFICSAGNLEEDRAYTHDLANPLRDRMGEVKLLTPNIDSFTDWSAKHNLDTRIIAYLNFKSSSLYQVDEDDNQKFTTPRGWERVSNLIKGYTDFKQVDLLTSTAISEGIAKEFTAFCKIADRLDIEDLIKNPSKIKDIKEIDVKYFLVSALSDKYINDKIDFKKVLEISEELDKGNNPEFVALLWKLSYGSKPSFKDDFLKNTDTDLINKYGKYLIE